jgi:glycosyltransferase involved in cell wall biosynthesis
LGHEVTILTYYKGSEVPGFRIIRTAPTPWHRDYEVGSSRHKLAFDALLSIRLARVLARNRFDVIHAHLHEGALIGSMIASPWRIPVCFDYQGSLTSEMLDHGFLRNSNFALALWKIVERLAERLPAHTFTSTRKAAEMLRQQTASHAGIEPLLDGVNTGVFRPDIFTREERSRRRMAYGIHEADMLVVYLGLLARHQGIDCLLQAAARLKVQGRKLKWMVMGYPGVEYWKSVAEQLGVGDHVIFTGRIPYENAPMMLALGDIAIAPKLSLTEGSGKILNYMAMALPTVAFETTAQVELLGNSGVYAAVGNVEQLAAEVTALADDPLRRTALGQKLRNIAVQQFSWDRVGMQMDAAYRGLIAARRRQPIAMRSGSDTLPL